MFACRRQMLHRLLVVGVAVVAWGDERASAGSGGWVEFENHTTQRLVAAPGLGVNDPDEKDYAWADVDHDGDLDVSCVRKDGWTTPGRRRNVLFMNEGIAEGHAVNGVLVDRTVEYASDADDGGQGFLDLTNDRDAVFADVNGDGWVDLITATTLGEGLPKTISHPRVYINKGAPEGVWLGFRYEEPRTPQLRSISNPHDVAPRFCSVAAGDIDHDGDVDLYFGDYDSAGAGGSNPENPADDVNDRLLINDGAGFFTDSLETRMNGTMLLSAFSMAAAIVDMNGDGFLDVVKDTALNTPQRVSVAYNNPANPGFFSGFDIIYDFSPYHTVVGDLNNDSRPDLVITDDGADRYMINTGNGPDGFANFNTRTFSFQGGGADDGFGGDNFIEDLNNDGFRDVLITDVDVDISGCNRRLHIYRNLGDAPNVTLQEQGGPAPWTPQGVHDLAVFDLNGDGWKDLLIGTCNGTQVWINKPPIGLVFAYPDGLPDLVPPGTTLAFRVRLTGVGTGQPLPGSGVFHVAIEDGEFQAIPMAAIEADLYEASFPATNCATSYRWYVSGQVEGGQEFFDPPSGAAAPYVAVSGSGTEITIRDEMEADTSAWTVVNEGVLAGAWEVAEPIGTLWFGQLAAPNQDASAAAEAVRAFVTGNGEPLGTPSAADVDGGPTRLISPLIDLAGTDGTVSYAQWFFCHNAGTPEADVLRIEVSNDDGATWSLVRDVTGTGGQWQVDSFAVGDYVEPTSQVRVRFSVADTPNNSLTEAGLDNFQVMALVCEQESLAILSSDPVDGSIDARQPFEVDGSGAEGWDRVTLTFNGNAMSLSPVDFELAQQGGSGETPTIVGVIPVDETTVQVVLSAPISVGAWTTVTHAASGSLVRVGSLPGDVNGDATASPVDVLALIDALNGALVRPVHSTDIDRSGATNPADILRVIDLLNGAGEYPVFNGMTLP